jgi:hypothetical protein
MPSLSGYSMRGSAPSSQCRDGQRAGPLARRHDRGGRRPPVEHRGYVLLGLPLVKVKTRHDLHIDANGSRVDSYVIVTNVRGRPVKINEVFILERRPKGGPGMSRPKDWTLPHTLLESQAVKFTFLREQYPNAIAIAIDSADRVWPRRRWFRVKRRAWSAGRLVGWPWQRNGPTDQQIARAVRRAEEARRRRSEG